MKKIIFLLLLSFSFLNAKSQESKDLVYYFDGDYYNACYIVSTKTERGEVIYELNDSKGFYTFSKTVDLYKPKDLPIDASIRGEIE